jgi:hypothetical protein
MICSIVAKFMEKKAKAFVPLSRLIVRIDAE